MLGQFITSHRNRDVRKCRQNKPIRTLLRWQLANYRLWNWWNPIHNMSYHKYYIICSWRPINEISICVSSYIPPYKLTHVMHSFFIFHSDIWDSILLRKIKTNQICSRSCHIKWVYLIRQQLKITSLIGWNWHSCIPVNEQPNFNFKLACPVRISCFSMT